MKVSKSKLRFEEQEVKYLGHWNSEGKKKLEPDRVSEILALPAPSTKQEIGTLLGLLGYCRQWIEEYSEKVKFLYEKLTQNSLKLSRMDKKRFQKIKEALITAPILNLPNITKPFQLYVEVSNSIRGVHSKEGRRSKASRRFF